MGKKGDLLRQAKLKRTTYTFTREQLAEHDRQVEDVFWKKKTAEIDAHINKVWDFRSQQFASTEEEENFMNMLRLIAAVSVDVLVRKFNWKPITKHDKRLKLHRFVEGFVAQINTICTDDNLDIREYADTVFDEYGIEFEVEKKGSD